MRDLRTERLLLRAFTEADRDIVYRISSDPGTTRYLFYFGNEDSTPEQDTDRFVRYYMTLHAQKPQRSVEYAVVDAENDVVMGDASIEYLSDTLCEIGWILLPEYRGKGYASEAGRELLRYGFQEMGAEKIIAHCDARNDASSRVMRRIGMTLIGIEPCGRRKKAFEEKPGDEMTWGIEREVWEQNWKASAKSEKPTAL